MRKSTRRVTAGFIAVAAALISVTPLSARASSISATTDVSSVVIDLSAQRMYLFDANGVRVASWSVSTGAPGTPTPVGKYKVTSKSRRTFVRSNRSVTMEWMIRFKGNYGIHAIPRKNGTPLWTPLGKSPVSHGCVRLSDAHAKELFKTLDVGEEVTVQR